MARTPEHVLREIVADLTFRLATLVAENERLQEELVALKADKTPK